MLPKKYRLTKREDFSAIFSKGTYVATNGGLSIKYLQNNQAFTRVGFPVGKNFSKKAVERNKARRILRAAIFPYLSGMKPGFDVVVMIRPGYQDIEFEQVSEQLKRVFSKANLFI